MPLYCSYVTILCIESKKNVKCNNKIKKFFSKKTRSYPFFIFSYKVCPPFSKKNLHTRSRPLKKSVKDLIYKHHLNIVQTTDEQPKILNIFSNSFSSNVDLVERALYDLSYKYIYEIFLSKIWLFFQVLKLETFFSGLFFNAFLFL